MVMMVGVTTQPRPTPSFDRHPSGSGVKYRPRSGRQQSTLQVLKPLLTTLEKRFSASCPWDCGSR